MSLKDLLGSAGGGGSKSRERRSRLVAKNSKLQEERRRRAKEEGWSGCKKVAAIKRASDGAVEEVNAIHPSRRARVANG